MKSSKCPNHLPKAGNDLFGFLNKNGEIVFLPKPIEATEEFIENAQKKGGPLEKRFRFSGNCSKKGCGHWDKEKSKCSLVNNIISINNQSEEGELFPCSIRKECRWYAQEGALACFNCKHVARKLDT